MHPSVRKGMRNKSKNNQDSFNGSFSSWSHFFLASTDDFPWIHLWQCSPKPVFQFFHLNSTQLRLYFCTILLVLLLSVSSFPSVLVTLLALSSWIILANKSRRCLKLLTSSCRENTIGMSSKACFFARAAFHHLLCSWRSSCNNVDYAWHCYWNY